MKGSQVSAYPIVVGDRVCHVKDPELEGEVKELDTNLPHPTTCRVLWDGYSETDVHWTDKLVKIQ